MKLLAVYQGAIFSEWKKQTSMERLSLASGNFPLTSRLTITDENTNFKPEWLGAGQPPETGGTIRRVAPSFSTVSN
jgi:hypothetical protein